MSSSLATLAIAGSVDVMVSRVKQALLVVGAGAFVLLMALSVWLWVDRKAQILAREQAETALATAVASVETLTKAREREAKARRKLEAAQDQARQASRTAQERLSAALAAQPTWSSTAVPQEVLNALE